MVRNLSVSAVSIFASVLLGVTLSLLFLIDAKSYLFKIMRTVAFFNSTLELGALRS
jgi:hypothetical protein